jgi:hypothetical protein
MQSAFPDGPNGPVKMLLTYDPLPEHREAYFRYVLGEFVPALEQMGLKMSEAWHTAYGDYPLRLAGFVAPDRATMQEVLDSRTFADLEARFKEYVVNYSRRVVPFYGRFQY